MLAAIDGILLQLAASINTFLPFQAYDNASCGITGSFLVDVLCIIVTIFGFLLLAWRASYAFD